MAKKKLIVVHPEVSVLPESKWEPILWMFGGLLMIIFALLIGTTNARWYLSNEGAIPQIDVFFLFIPGILLLLFGFKVTKNYLSSEDISARQAVVWLILFLAIGLSIRLYRMDIPFGRWWGDDTFFIFNSWEMFVHHDIHLINEWGWNPCFPYCVEVAVFKFLPNLSGPATLKTTTVVFEMLSMGIFYLLGKEVGGRRTGIILVALALISREMITENCEYSCTFFIITLTLLVFFRLIHKPTFWRFVQWGAVTAFGLYNVNVYRAWVPFVLIAVSLWVLFHSEERRSGIWSYGLSLGGSFVWLIWYFRASHFISENSFLINSFFWFLMGLVFVSFVQIVRRFIVNGSGSLSIGFGLGLTVAAILFYPLVASGDLYHRTNQVMDLKTIFAPGALLKFCSDSSMQLINILFVDGQDLPIVGPDHQTLFNLHAAVFIFLGLAFLIAQPSREKIWALLAVIPGVLPYIITTETHMGRLWGVLPPLYLLAALGLDRFWGIFSKKAGAWGPRFFGITFLMAFWIWAGWANIQSVRAWSTFPRSTLVNVWEQAMSDVDHGRVYIAPFSVDYDNLEALQTLINHQNIYGLGTSNPIFLSPGEKTPDVIVLCPNDDQNNLEILRREFPQASWTEVLNKPLEKPSFHLWRIQISGNQINANNRQLFFVSEITSDIWTRKFYGSDYGIGKGVIYCEDAVLDPHAPFPSKKENWMGSGPFSVRLEKKIEIEKPGSYIFSVQSTGCIRLLLENEKKYKIFDRDTYGKDQVDSTTVQLDKGTYQVDYCYAPEYEGVPKVMIQFPNSSKTEW